jgi:hypothetical protein
MFALVWNTRAHCAAMGTRMLVWVACRLGNIRVASDDTKSGEAFLPAL